MSTKLRVAVVGAGVGVKHAEAFRALPEQFELVAVAAAHEDRARAFAQRFEVPSATIDLTDLCGRADLDVIDLCTPPFQHFAQVQQALAAGKHVICEKPLVGSLKETDELVAAERQSGRRIMPIFQYRFGHGLQKLKLLVDHGVAGRAYLTTVETAWRRRTEYYAVPWRGKWATELGGTLITHAIHAHDLVSYVLGPFRSVFARTATRVHVMEVEDCAAISIEMADGSLASLSVTVGSAEQISRHRFCFSNLSAESHTAPYTNTTDPWKITPDTPEAAESIRATLADYWPLPEGFAGQFSRFHQALETGNELPVTLQDARDSIELLTAIYTSAQTGRPVELPIGPDDPAYAGWCPRWGRETSRRQPVARGALDAK